MTRVIVLLLPLLLLCTGCDLKKREEALKQKEAALAEREQQLTFREKSVAIKEEELLQLQKHLDSTKISMDSVKAINDTALIYNQQLIGNWSVRMTCTETTCTGSAVGDTKTETWNISYDSSFIVAKAIAGDKLVRVYTGSYVGTNLTLSENVTNVPSEPATKMTIRLTTVDDNTMEGQREIVRENDCRIVYSLQLSKQKLSTK